MDHGLSIVGQAKTEALFVVVVSAFIVAFVLQPLTGTSKRHYYKLKKMVRANNSVAKTSSMGLCARQKNDRLVWSD